MGPDFALSGTAVAVSGTVGGILLGAIATLFKQLIASKQAEIAERDKTIMRLIGERDEAQRARDAILVELAKSQRIPRPPRAR